jgi:5-methylcytosine-specific restriction endonuclease McrA
VWNSGRPTDSGAKRVRRDKDAGRLGGAGASARAETSRTAPGRCREAEQPCEPPVAMRGNGGRAGTLAKRQVRAGGDSQGAAGRHSVAGTRGASWVPVQGHRFTTSAAKWLASGSRDGPLPPAERSPALERHLATLSCLDSLPGARSRYIPAAVRRAVWRRDQGCCSFVDRHSGQRCSSRYRLEIDHVVPFALGGANELSNLRLHCRAHHRLRHTQHHAEPASDGSVPRSGAIRR